MENHRISKLCKASKRVMEQKTTINMVVAGEGEEWQEEDEERQEEKQEEEEEEKEKWPKEEEVRGSKRTHGRADEAKNNASLLIGQWCPSIPQCS